MHSPPPPKWESWDDEDDEADVVAVSSLMPSGRALTISIKSTWGDNSYVGLCGIEFFDENGDGARHDVPSTLIRAHQLLSPPTNGSPTFAS